MHGKSTSLTSSMHLTVDTPENVWVCEHSSCLCLRASLLDLFVLKVVIRTDNIEVAGEIVQDLAGYLGIVELQSSAEFPQEMSSFKDVLARVRIWL